MKKFFLTLIFLLLIVFPSCAEKFLELRIPCEAGGKVTATLPNGETFELGTVKMIPSKANYMAYTASKWAEPSTVCAAAVNAIHILLGVFDNRGRIISLVPSLTVAPAAVQGAFFSIESEAGTGIFGGFAPFTGSHVCVEHEGRESPLTDIPSEGDVLVIRSPLGASSYMADIENRPGGRVIVHDKNGARTAARVVRPVKGVGRFGGSVFQERGRIRASHSGVICTSTSRRGFVGGFQIMPLKHALTSPEMSSSWNLTQWLIIAPLPGMPDLEGTPPLFKKAFVPGPQLSDKLPDMFSHYGRKPLVLCRIDGGDWERLPVVEGKVDDGLASVTHLRFYFPLWEGGF